MSLSFLQKNLHLFFVKTKNALVKKAGPGLHTFLWVTPVYVKAHYLSYLVSGYV